jgi:hypothetical protein
MKEHWKRDFKEKRDLFVRQELTLLGKRPLSVLEKIYILEKRFL